MDRNRIYKQINIASNSISIFFDIESRDLLDIGDQINLLNNDAYMHGFNWAILIEYYLKQINPQLTDGLKNVSGTGMCIFCYDLSPENEIKSDKTIEVIGDFITDKSLLFKIVEEEKNIEWIP